MIPSDYCRLMSYLEAVTEAITKPYHVTWWVFADESVSVNWLQLLLEYIYLLNHLPAGSVVHLFPSHSPCELCVKSSRKKTWMSYLQTWNNRAMEGEYKIFSFFLPFFFWAHKGLAVRPYTLQLCQWSCFTQITVLLLFVTTTTREHNVLLFFCTRDRWRALGQDFQI